MLNVLNSPLFYADNKYFELRILALYKPYYQNIIFSNEHV